MDESLTDEVSDEEEANDEADDPPAECPNQNHKVGSSVTDEASERRQTFRHQLVAFHSFLTAP